MPFLQSILAAWQAELSKKAVSMSRDDALRVLGVTTDDLSPNVAPDSDPALRKAYHRLAAKYHPDKNPRPEARELFERVQKSYEFLCAESRLHGGPDRYNISLMLRAQVILYRRCAETLEPFKYAGYPLLLRALEIPADADDSSSSSSSLFSEENGKTLLPACELLAATLAAAPLNAHELQRVGGIEAVVRLFTRCVS